MEKQEKFYLNRPLKRNIAYYHHKNIYLYVHYNIISDTITF
jgi:hypothetical protein